MAPKQDAARGAGGSKPQQERTVSTKRSDAMLPALKGEVESVRLQDMRTFVWDEMVKSRKVADRCFAIATNGNCSYLIEERTKMVLGCCPSVIHCSLFAFVLDRSLVLVECESFTRMMIDIRNNRANVGTFLSTELQFE